MVREALRGGREKGSWRKTRRAAPRREGQVDKARTQRENTRCNSLGKASWA